MCLSHLQSGWFSVLVKERGPLMAAAGTVFVLTRDYWLLLVAATIGVISPSGHEVDLPRGCNKRYLAGSSR